MTFTSPFDRVDPPDVNSELATLNSWLDYERATLLTKLEGLTEEEYQKALATPLLFNKDGSESEKDCLERAKKAIKNSRSTNPMKKD